MFPSKTAILSGGSGFINQYSLEFDGTNDYVDCGDDTSLDITDDITMACWVKSSTLPTSDGQETIMGRDDATNRNYTLYIQEGSGNVKFYWDYFVSDVAQRVSSSTSLSVDTWYHVVCTRDKATGANIIYVNGVDEETHTDSTTAIDNDDVQFAIGARGNGTNFFEGFIDEVAIWDTVLTAAQVLEIYNAKGRIDLKTVSGSNLKGYWRMGDGDLDDGNVAGNGLIGDQNSPTLGSELVANGDDDSTLPTINSQALEYYYSSGALSTEQAYSGTKSLKVSCTSTGGNDSKVRFADGSDCGLTSGTLYKMSVWVYIPSGQGALNELVLRYKPNGGSNTTVNSTTTTDTWVNLIGYFTDNDVTRFFEVKTPADTDGDYFYVDVWSVKAVSGNPGIMTSMAATFSTDVPPS